MYPDVLPLDRPSWCDDCDVKLNYDLGEVELCTYCRAARLDEPCPDCGADGGEDCLMSCGSMLV